MRLFSLAVLALPVAIANAISIVGPNENAYWVQNATNTISWNFNQSDPAAVDIVVVNANNATLNGVFSIARFVNVTTQTFTVTNVTLRPGDGYQVEFVNSTNATQVFAASPTFTVKPPGTSPAPTVSVTLSSSAAAGSATAPSSSGTGTASATGAAGGSNSALSVTNGQGIYGMLAACGIASLSALLL